MEGVGCMLAGFFGTGFGVTSYSENIAVISITKVASRLVSCVIYLYNSFGYVHFSLKKKFSYSHIYIYICMHFA